MFRRRNNLFKELLEDIKALYIKNEFNKATSISWIQYFNCICNLCSYELDEDEKAFISIVFWDKIASNLECLQVNMIISLIFSFASFDIQENEIYEVILNRL